MKNLFLLPIDKLIKSVGDLVKDQYGYIHIFTKNDGKEYGKTTTKLNILITSDEEIKEGDYIIDNYAKINLVQKVRKCDFDSSHCKNGNWKKIILTTDQELIKDGVQAIDDDFLEWFVKNPSCEWVEVFKLPKQQLSSNYYSTINWIDNNIYKIIISKEEHKQETLEELKKWKQEALIAHEINQKVIEKLMAEKKLMYSEEDMTKFVSFVGKNYIKAKGFYYMKGDFEKKHKVSIHQILEQFKNK
jgi:hypothetical protein